MNDFANWKDFTGSAFLNAVAQQAYAGLGYNWVNAINSHQAQARLGIVIGRSTDVSLYATHLFGTGREPLYGGSLRAIF